MPRRSLGFTLVELMIVVAIIGVLAVIAGTAYRKYMDSGRSAEVYSMLGELRTKQEAYKAEFSTYLSTGANETSFHPALLSTGQEPKAKTWATGAPAQWGTLGIAPGKSQLYCGYVAIAGNAGTPPTGTRGKAIFPTAPTVAWWYAVATCDNDSDSTTNAFFTTSSQTTSVFSENEHR